MLVPLQLNEQKKTATWEQIKAKRNELELSEIELDDGRVFDFDKDAIDRFKGTIERWDHLVNKTPEDLFRWKLFTDETELLSRQNLIEILEELEIKQAIRADILHFRAQILKLNPPTVEELQDLATWGI